MAGRTTKFGTPADRREKGRDSCRGSLSSQTLGRHTPAEELEGEIERAVARRAQAWRVRPVDGAVVRAETQRLDKLWEAVRIARRLKQAGLSAPKLRVVRFASVEDVVNSFVEERCELAFEAWASVADVRSAYVSWAVECGGPELSAKALTAALHGRGVGSGRTKRARLYLGIRLAGDRSASDLKVKAMHEHNEKWRGDAAA